MILAAEYTPSPLRLMLGRHSGIGNRIPRFPVFCRESGREPPIPDLAGKRGIPDSRFGRESGIGVPIRRAGDFLVCVTRSKLARKRRPGPPELKPPRGGLL